MALSFRPVVPQAGAPCISLSELGSLSQALHRRPTFYGLNVSGTSYSPTFRDASQNFENFEEDRRRSPNFEVRIPNGEVRRTVGE